MEFIVRWSRSGIFAELTIKDGNAEISIGLMDKREIEELINKLKEAAEELSK